MIIKYEDMSHSSVAAISAGAGSSITKTWKPFTAQSRLMASGSIEIGGIEGMVVDSTWNLSFEDGIGDMKGVYLSQ